MLARGGCALDVDKTRGSMGGLEAAMGVEGVKNGDLVGLVPGSREKVKKKRQEDTPSPSPQL